MKQHFGIDRRKLLTQGTFTKRRSLQMIEGIGLLLRYAMNARSNQ
jgi:hypothetical protein